MPRLDKKRLEREKFKTLKIAVNHSFLGRSGGKMQIYILNISAYFSKTQNIIAERPIKSCSGSIHLWIQGKVCMDFFGLFL